MRLPPIYTRPHPSHISEKTGRTYLLGVRAPPSSPMLQRPLGLVIYQRTEKIFARAPSFFFSNLSAQLSPAPSRLPAKMAPTRAKPRRRLPLFIRRLPAIFIWGTYGSSCCFFYFVQLFALFDGCI